MEQVSTLTASYHARVQSGEFKSDPAQLDVIDKLEALEATLVAQKSGLLSRLKRQNPTPIGLYIWGGVGRGKSMLMDLFFDNSQVQSKRRVHFHGFMQQVHDGIHQARQTKVKDAILPVANKIASETRLLCFDEMQITDITDAMIVGRLFGYLMQKGVTIVATSNRHPDDLYENGLNRQLFLPFIGTIKDNMNIAELQSGADYRRGRIIDEKRYFSPIDEGAKSGIARLWDKLAQGEGEQLVLHVKSREVRLPKFRNGVAWADFSDLCDNPLGPRDFLAIAGAVRVLIIENIPTMSRSKNNQAKRFVTLIDALYEARVILIASAEAAPDDLYPDGAGSFEFKRTASRLNEMQTADWAND
jgi:cell division protein ZapE